MENPVLAMLDTGAPWCMFNPQVGEYIQRNFEPVSDTVLLSTRIGTFSGSLYRVPLIFTAIESEQVDIDATVFVSPHWAGGNFLAYEGLLQRIRFAVDPEENLFYFGPL
jgi:hypothetical protein